MLIFSWDDWNEEHIAKHRVSREEAEYIVRHAQEPFPREIGDDKHLVWGKTPKGRYLEIIFVFRDEDEIEYDSLELPDVLELADGHATAVYVIHAMDLTPRMRRQYRRQ